MLKTTLKKVARQIRLVGLAAPILIFAFICALHWNVPFSSASDGPNETIYYILTDHLGSTDVVMDEEGNVVERADYLPYGSDRLRWQDENAPETDYQYTGKEMDDETGLYYYGARYYDPTIGRFINVDPWEGDLTNPQSLNKYSYVFNNPIKFIDPTGKWGVLPIVGGQSHQMLTKIALEVANINKDWVEEHRDALVYGASTYADIIVKFKGETDPSLHSTTPSDVTSAVELKARMMEHAERFYKSTDDKEFGRLIHMAQDSYCPSHTKRDENGNITAFYDFEKQKLLEHIQGDSVINALDNENINATIEAVNVAKVLIEFRASGAPWEEAEQHLDETVWKLADNATINTGGDEFEKDESND